MTAEIEVLVGQKKDVLQIPVQCVVERGGKFRAYVKTPRDVGHVGDRVADLDAIDVNNRCSGARNESGQGGRARQAGAGGRVDRTRDLN